MFRLCKEIAEPVFLPSERPCKADLRFIYIDFIPL